MNKCLMCLTRYHCEGKYEFDCIQNNYNYFVKDTEKYSKDNICKGCSQEKYDMCVFWINDKCNLIKET